MQTNKKSLSINTSFFVVDILEDKLTVFAA